MSLDIPESRFQMPALFKPGRKPIGRVKVDWTHPFTKHLVGCFIFQDGKLENLAKTGLMDDGTSSFNIDRGRLISPASQSAGDAVLAHADINVFARGGSLVVGVQIESYPNTYGSIACLDTINNSGKNGFAVGIQNSNRFYTYWNFGNTSGTKRIDLSLGNYFVISASTDATNNHELIINGTLASLSAADYWHFGAGLCANNNYFNTRGDLLGEYQFYLAFDIELPVYVLMSLNKNPMQFLIPA